MMRFDGDDGSVKLELNCVSKLQESFCNYKIMSTLRQCWLTACT